MNRLRAAVLAMAALCTSAHAAEITRIASSFEDDHPFGAFLDLGFQRTQRRMLITHEFHTNGEVQNVAELRYTGADARLNMDARIGIYKDLELHIGVPLVFSQNETWWYAAGTTPSNSTLARGPNNCVDARGVLVDPSCPTTGAGSRDLFQGPAGGPGIPGGTFRGGLGNATFGLAYAVFDQKKDDTKPMWIVGLEYEAPTAEKLDPSVITTTDSHGAIGDRIHKYKLYTSLSRRMGAADPYTHAYLELPYHGPGWYSNCDNPSDANMGRKENCLQGPWTRDETGIKPPVKAGLWFGSEFVFLDAPAKHQKIALDLRVQGDYVGSGRYYNELSGLFGKLMYSADYLQLGGMLGLSAHASDYVRIQVLGTLLYATPHSLSDEPIGIDLPDPVTGQRDGVINLSANPLEINPNYDYRADVVSRRFRASEIWVFRIDVNASFNF